MAISQINIKAEIYFTGTPVFGLRWDDNDKIIINDLQSEYLSETYHFEISKKQNTSDLDYKTTGFFEIETTDKRRQLFEELAKQKKGICIQDENGVINQFLVGDKVYEKVLVLTRNAFRKFRWRFGLDLRSNIETKLHLCYSIDLQDWYEIVHCPAITGLEVYSVNVQEDPKLIHDFASVFFKSQIEEPIYHDLIREAKLITYPNYKSAFAIAVAALESATKEFLAVKIEMARNLIYKFPSPDMHQIFTSIIPEIEPQFKLKNDYESKLKNLMSVRNSLMHKGAMSLDFSRTSEYIRFIEKLISLIDYFSGYAWSDITLAKKILENEK